MSLRPSSLPKLAQCAKFEGDGVGDEYTARGARLDEKFRALLAGNEQRIKDPTEEQRGVYWAVDVTHMVADGEEILAREDDLRIECLEMTGTADAAIPTKNYSIDLKSGEERNYLEQQAAYALGFMEKYFTEEWTVFLLYCDLRKSVKLQFTREQAESVVRAVVARVLDDAAIPTPCEYCDWCGKRYQCRERLERVAWWAGRSPGEINWEEELADPGKLSAFLTLCRLISKEDGLEALARRTGLALIQAGTEVPGYAISSRKGDEYILPNDVGHWIDDMGHGVILEAYGRLSAKKFREAWEKRMPGKDFPSDIVQHGAGSVFIKAVTKPNKTTK